MAATEKLVRDKMPELCSTRPGWSQMTYREASASEYIEVLLNKLVEEAGEVKGAGWERITYFENPNALVEELADLSEVMQTVCRFFGITPEEIEAARTKKFEERGGFDKGIIWDGKK